MVKTERAGSASADSGRSDGTSAGSRRDRMSRYATVAKMAAVIPAAALASGADGAIYSQTGLSMTVTANSGVDNDTAAITGAGGVQVATLYVTWRFPQVGSFASIYIFNGNTFANFKVKDVYAVAGSTTLVAGFIAAGGATWDMAGPTASSSAAEVWFGGSGNGGWNDPQNVGGGQTWYLLFQFTDGAAAGNYGWVSFVASDTIGYQTGSITITGWGWDDSGAKIGAGVTASVIPGGTGLAALAIGAAGLRGRRRSRN